MKVHVYILLGYEPKFIQVPIGKGNFFFRKSKKAERRHLENVERKRYTKFEASKSMGSTLKTTNKNHWVEKQKKKQQKKDDNILSPK